jgi:hypothetical protein
LILHCRLLSERIPLVSCALLLINCRFLPLHIEISLLRSEKISCTLAAGDLKMRSRHTSQ